MIENIAKVLDRGEKLDLLVNKTELLQGEAFAFRREASRARRLMWWKARGGRGLGSRGLGARGDARGGVFAAQLRGLRVARMASLPHKSRSRLLQRSRPSRPTPRPHPAPPERQNVVRDGWMHCGSDSGARNGDVRSDVLKVRVTAGRRARWGGVLYGKQSQGRGFVFAPPSL